jgi:hypothetical protein
VATLVHSPIFPECGAFYVDRSEEIVLKQILQSLKTGATTVADGSIGSIHYLANGHKSFPKERLEVFAGGRILQLDNFRKLTGFGWPGFSKMNLWRQNKGQKACAAAFVQAVEQGGAAPIPFEELMEVSRVSIEVAEALR